LKTRNETFLDLGCAFAQDIRRLVADGVDSSKCYGSDLRLEFMDLGYELFRDKETLQSRFIEGDVFDESSPLSGLNGKIDVVGASAFFHLFSWEEQKIVARRVAKLLKPQKGSLVVGVQVGHNEPSEHPKTDGGSRFRHNLESWRKMWNEVGEDIGVRFEIDGIERSLENEFRRIGDMFMEFTVRRVS
jgi:SAM-dependent methyltransferase